MDEGYWQNQGEKNMSHWLTRSKKAAQRDAGSEGQKLSDDG
jgi:hypothetical protein